MDTTLTKLQVELASAPQLMQDYQAPAGVNGALLGHRHVEAFAIMRYQNRANPRDIIYVWNSRDGVTPFCIFVNGCEYSHVNWPQDRYAPNYRPAEGELIFRDCTEEEAAFYADRRIAQYKDTPYYPKSEEDRQRVRQALIDEAVKGPILARVSKVTVTSEALKSSANE